jgi:hypothetical protein
MLYVRSNFTVFKKAKIKRWEEQLGTSMLHTGVPQERCPLAGRARQGSREKLTIPGEPQFLVH